MVLWSGLVSRVGASPKVNLSASLPPGQNCPKKKLLSMSMSTDVENITWQCKDMNFIFEWLKQYFMIELCKGVKVLS